MLLVACVNVANLLLARSAARERELGLRTALGAERGRLMRQMLTESLVLAAAGGIAGLASPRCAIAACSRWSPIASRFRGSTRSRSTSRWSHSRWSWRSRPDWCSASCPRASPRSHANDAVRDGGRHGGGRRLHRVLSTLVVAEVALSLVLLTGAGLLMRSFVKLQSTDLGFRAEGVLTAGVQLPATRYDLLEPAVSSANLCRASRVLPGVQHAAGASCLPVPFPCIGTGFWRVDRAEASGRTIVVEPGAAGDAGILQDDGHSAGGGT